jgi:putative tricarboxylic transport membrane protein
LISLTGKKDILVGVIVAVLWLGFGWASQRFESSGFTDRLGPAYFPTLLAVAGFGLSLIVILTAAFGSRQNALHAEAAAEPRPNYRRALAMLCVPFAWPLVVPYVGFLIATPPLLVVLLLLLGVRSPRQLGTVAFILTTVLWVVFEVLFGVEFPGPRWGG